MNELRGAYKEFLNSEVGKDLLKRLIVQETALTISAMRATDTAIKCGCVDELRGVHWVRDLLDDLSKPSTPLRAGEHSSGPKSS